MGKALKDLWPTSEAKRGKRIRIIIELDGATNDKRVHNAICNWSDFITVFHMKTAWGCGAVMFLQYFLWFGNQSVGMFVMARQKHHATIAESQNAIDALQWSFTRKVSSLACGKVSQKIDEALLKAAKFHTECMCQIHVWWVSLPLSLSLSFSLRVLMRMHSLENDDSIIPICVWQEEL